MTAFAWACTLAVLVSLPLGLGVLHECRMPIATGAVIHKLSSGAYVHQGCQP